jgi:hypothetical protein
MVCDPVERVEFGLRIVRKSRFRDCTNLYHKIPFYFKMAAVFSSDFVYGAATVISLLAVLKIYALLSSPTVGSIEKKAKAPVPKIGDDASITVWGFALDKEYPGYPEGVCDVSPYVMRVECYLRLIEKDYVKAKSVSLTESPRGKLPVANVKGKMVDDSSRILDMIMKEFSIDEKLNEKQRSLGHLVRNTLTGSLYWVTLHFTFGTDVGRNAICQEFAKDIPAPIIPFVTHFVIRGQTANVQGSGIAKVPHDDIVEKGCADLRALAQILGKQTYILGTEKPTSCDTDMYAFVGFIFYNPITANMVWMKRIKKELPLLEQYTDRLRNQLFPDLKKTK